MHFEHWPLFIEYALLSINWVVQIYKKVSHNIVYSVSEEPTSENRKHIIKQINIIAWFGAEHSVMDGDTTDVIFSHIPWFHLGQGGAARRSVLITLNCRNKNEFFLHMWLLSAVFLP